MKIALGQINSTIGDFSGNSAKIIDYARSLPADLIVLATHGYTGMKRLMFGSVALQVLHDAKVPVLLIRAFPGPEKA